MSATLRRGSVCESSTTSSTTGRRVHGVDAAGKPLGTPSPAPIESFVWVLPQPPKARASADDSISTLTSTTTLPLRRGVLRYVGPTDFGPGVWAGVELVGALGRNSGAGKTQRYFDCLPGQGVFVRPELVRPYHSDDADAPEDGSVGSRASAAPAEHEAAVALMQELEARLHAVEAENTALKAAAAAGDAERASSEAAWAAKLADETAKRTAAEANLAALLDDEAAADIVLDDDVPEATAEARAAGEDAESRVAALEEERRAAQAALEEKTRAMDSAVAEAAAARSDVASARAETAALEAKFREAAASLDSLARQLKAEQEARLQAERTAEASRGGDGAPPAEAQARTIAALEADTQRLSGERDQLRRALEEAKAAAATATEQHQHLPREAEAAPAAADTTATAATAAMEKVSRQEDIIAALAKERDELREMCEMLEEELQAEKTQSDEMGGLLKKLADERAAEAAAFEEERDSLAAKAAAQTELIQAANAEAHKWRTQCQLEQDRVTALSAVAAAAQKPAAGVMAGEAEGAASSAAEERVEALTEELNAARMEMFQLKMAAESGRDAQEQHARVLADLDKARRKAKKREDSLVQEYEEALNHMRSYKDKVQGENAHLKSEVARLEKAVAEAAAEARAGRPSSSTAAASSTGAGKSATADARGGEAATTTSSSAAAAATGTLADDTHHRQGSGDDDDGGMALLPLPTTSTVPLSDWERGRYERTIWRLERTLLQYRLSRHLPLADTKPHADEESRGGADWLQSLRDAFSASAIDNRRSPAPSPSAAVVLDFSTPEARKASSRAMLSRT